MIFPQKTDLGRRVVYRPPGAGRRYGVISAIYTRRVFVRFDHQHYSRAVNEAYLEFAKRPAETVPRSHGILTSGAARPRRLQPADRDASD
jgi:hypothetical protein